MTRNAALLSYAHQPAASPYRASGPIFVRRDAQPCTLPPGVVPPHVTRRLISLRAYDAHDLMVDGQVVEGTDVETVLVSLFERPDVAYVHLHNAKRRLDQARGHAAMGRRARRLKARHAVDGHMQRS